MELDIFGNQYDLQTRLMWDLNDLRLAITDRFMLKHNTTTIDGKVATQAFSEFYNTTFIAFANDVTTSIAKYFDTYQLQNRTINEPIIFGETLEIVYRMLLAQGRKMSEHPTMAKSFSQIESEYNRSPRKVGDTLFKAIEKANAPEPEPETPNADNTPAEDIWQIIHQRRILWQIIHKAVKQQQMKIQTQM